MWQTPAIIRGNECKCQILLLIYSELRLEVARMWNKKTVVVPIIIGALGSVPMDLQSYLKQLDIPYDLNIKYLNN